jgi:nucleotide-binding universal stress UspA family protein
MTRFTRILVATDGSTACSRAVDTAIELARSLGIELVTLAVAPGPEAADVDLSAATDPLGAAEEATMALIRHLPEAGEATAAGWARAAADRGAAAGVQTRPVVWEGPVAESIIAAAEAESADLIVVASDSRRAVGRIVLRSVSEHVIRASPVPVLVVRPAPEPARSQAPGGSGTGTG